MRIAIIGAGVSGLVAAWLLQDEHEIVVFEAAGHVGGHAHTVEVDHEGDRHPVDTGFVVYNERNYPNFVRLLARLSVETRPTTMSFSVRCDRSGYEYCTSSLGALFAQRRNLLRPAHYRMLLDVVRFQRSASRIAQAGAGVETPTLGEFLAETRMSRAFVERYLVPMGAAIWSTQPSRMLEFPASFFLRFFDNHGLLTIQDQPRWRTIVGGSQRYVAALTASFRDRIRLRTPIARVTRHADHVEVKPRIGPSERFDQVIFAVHADQALRMLGDASTRERDILSAFPYQPNRTVLHADPSLLPQRRTARASWNYHIAGDPGEPVAVTYDMSRLQGLPTRDPLCVTLNREPSIAPGRVHERIDWEHPVYLPQSIDAQRRWREISGAHRTHFAGAYWGNGFHEDGVASGLAVCERFGKGL